MSDKTTIPKDKQTDLPENQRQCRSLLEKSEQSRRALLGILKDQKQTEKKLRRLNRALRTLSECNQVLIRVTDEMELLSSVCRIMVETGGYPMAWVGYVGSDEAQTIHPVAQSGCPPGLLETYGLTLADSENGQVPAGRAIQTCQPFLTRPPTVDPLHAFLQERGIRQRLVCSLTFPIFVGPRTIGAMNIHSQRAKAFDSEEVALLQELVNDLAFGIAALRTRRAHARAEADLSLFRQLINQFNDGIFVHDSETGRILDVNDTGCRLLGYSREELLHLSPTDFDPTMQDPSRWAEALKQVRAAGSMQQDSPALQMVPGHETILLVEDEPSILSITMQMLEKLGYRVLAAATPGEAIRLAKAQAGEIHLLITDVVMPQMNGQELAKNIHSLYPGIRALFMSGYTGNVVAHHGALEQGVLFLQKPFTMQALAAKTREALDHK